MPAALVVSCAWCIRCPTAIHTESVCWRSFTAATATFSSPSVRMLSVAVHKLFFSLLCSCVLERCAVCPPLSVCHLNFLTASESTSRHFSFQFELGLSLTTFVNRLREWLLLLGRPTIVGRSSVLSVGYFPLTFHPRENYPSQFASCTTFPLLSAKSRDYQNTRTRKHMTRYNVYVGDCRLLHILV